MRYATTVGEAVEAGAEIRPVVGRGFEVAVNRDQACGLPPNRVGHAHARL